MRLAHPDDDDDDEDEDDDDHDDHDDHHDDDDGDGDGYGQLHTTTNPHLSQQKHQTLSPHLVVLWTNKDFVLQRLIQGIDK